MRDGVAVSACVTQQNEILRITNRKRIEQDGSFVWLPADEPHEWVVFGMTQEEESFMKSRGGTLRGNEFFDFLDVTRRSRGNVEN